MKIHKIIIGLLLFALPVLSMSQNINDIISKLNSKDYTVRTNARVNLQKRLNKAVWEKKEGGNRSHIESCERQLISTLKQQSSNEDIVVFVIRMLGYYGSDKSIEPLSAFLLDDNINIQDEARRALAEMRGEKVEKSFVDALSKAKPGQKRGLIDAISGLESPALSKHIIPYLNSENKDLVYASVRAIATLKNSSDTPVLLKLYHSTDDIVLKSELEKTLVNMGVDNSTLVHLIFNGNNQSVRLGAYTRLLEMDLADYKPWDSSVPKKHRGANLILKSIVSDNSFPYRHQFFSVTMNGENESIQGYLVENISKFNSQEQLATLVAIRVNRIIKYEKDVIGLLSSQYPDVRNEAIRVLGTIGTSEGSKVLYNLYLENATDNTLANALSIIQDPQLDIDMAQIIKSGTAESREKEVAIKILASRDLYGNLGLIHGVAKEAGNSVEIRKSALRVLEKGNVESAKILMSFATAGGELTKPAQVSLKKLSGHIADRRELWEEVYKPVLTGSCPDKTKIDAIMILDGFPCAETLEYLKDALAGNYGETIKNASTKNLKRWVSPLAGEVWLSLINKKGLSEKEKRGYCNQIKRLIEVKPENMEHAESQISLAVKAIKSISSEEYKLIILEGINASGEYFKPYAAKLEALMDSEKNPVVITKVEELLDKAKKES